MQLEVRANYIMGAIPLNVPENLKTPVVMGNQLAQSPLFS